MRLKALTTIVLVTVCLTALGCYGTSHFKSNTAQIHFFGWTRMIVYRVVFDEIRARDSTTVTFEFDSPPPDQLGVYLQFPDIRDVDRLHEKNARVQMTILDDKDNEVFSGGGVLPCTGSDTEYNARERRWEFRSVLRALLPPDWSRIDGSAVYWCGDETLRTSKNRKFRLIVHLTIDGTLSRDVRLVPMIAGPT